MTFHHVPVRLSVVLAMAVIAGAGAHLRGQVDADPEIVFETPADNSYASGATTIRVQVNVKGGQARSVSLFADGALVCTRERPPFECAWNAGPNVVEHLLRATALLPDGRRVARSIRTRGVEYTETVDVDVVPITAVVTAGKGHFIRGLTRDRFRVFEDGVPQTITSFTSEDAPLELVVAVDFSGSMTNAMPTVKAAMKKFLQSLKPEDHVTLLGFNNSVFTLAPPTVDLAARLKVVDRLRPWGGTALYDAIIRSVGDVGKQPGRHAIVIFSDGEDLHSKAPLEAAETRLETSDAVMYAIGQGRAPDIASLRAILERLSAKSGGRAFFEDLEALDSVFHEIVADLSNQYLIGYVPLKSAHDGEWREVRVDIPGTNYEVRTRRGYRALTR